MRYIKRARKISALAFIAVSYGLSLTPNFLGTGASNSNESLHWPRFESMFGVRMAQAQVTQVNPKVAPVQIVTEKGGQDFAVSRVTPNRFIAPSHGAARVSMAFTIAARGRRILYSGSLYSEPEPMGTYTAGSIDPAPMTGRHQSTFNGECGIFEDPGNYECTIQVPRERFDASHQWEYVTISLFSLDKGKDLSRTVPGPHNYDTVQSFKLEFTRAADSQQMSAAFPREDSAPSDVVRLRAERAVAAANLESNTNRYGSDYRNFEAADARRCQAACASEAQCKSWTWVKPGVQGPNANCWLKNQVPPESRNDCCVSGVKQ